MYYMYIFFLIYASSSLCLRTYIVSAGNTEQNILLFLLGRRSLTKFSSYIKEYNCYQIEINKDYTIHDWRDDIKNIMLKAGLQNQPIVFLFSDMHVKCRPENVELNEKV